MVVFHTMIDIAVLKTLMLWLFKNPRRYERKHGQRHGFVLHKLGKALVLLQIERRHVLTGLRSDTRLAIDAIVNRTTASPQTSSTGATASVAK